MAEDSSAAAGETSEANEHERQTRETIADTLISIIIAFALAFVFRGFVVEAFVIPTGSMAPTLMGAHMRFDGPQTGFDWPVGPWEYINNDTSRPRPLQGSAQNPIRVHDPMGGTRIERTSERIRAGDRILVLKYLYSIREPKPFEVVVFKNPTRPAENYIKRLIGLPGEQIALVDGDVFVRAPGAPVATNGASAWDMTGWKIRRKPARVQQAVWQPVFDSRWGGQTAGFQEQPWQPDDQKTSWDVTGRHYVYETDKQTTLRFDQGAKRIEPGMNLAAIYKSLRFEEWAIDDRYPYNERLPISLSQFRMFPVSDLRVRTGIVPGGDGLNVRATIEARSHRFEAAIRDGEAVLSVEPIASMSPTDPVREQASFKVPALRAGVPIDLEFWHVDQTLQLWIDGERVGLLEYGDHNGNGWTPAERFRNATGRDLADAAGGPAPPGRMTTNPLGDPRLYHRPEVSITFEGAPFKLHRTGLDRDLFYQPNGSAKAGLGTHPSSPLSLGKDQFFCLGDNSPNSEDGRTWGTADAWVREQLSSAGEGVVPRRLLLGKAFFVYFPSLHKDKRVPVVDFGRMRFIW